MAVPAGSSTGEVDGGEAAWSTKGAEAAASTRTTGRQSAEEEAAAAALQEWRPTAPRCGGFLPGAPGAGREAAGDGRWAREAVPSLASGDGDGEQGVVSRHNHLLTEAPGL